jgi:hypothetical protein
LEKRCAQAKGEVIEHCFCRISNAVVPALGEIDSATVTSSEFREELCITLLYYKRVCGITCILE